MEEHNAPQLYVLGKYDRCICTLALMLYAENIHLNWP